MTANATVNALPANVERAITSAPRGSYQRGLIAGTQSWSGSDLRGKARTWGSRYAASRRSLLQGINAALPAGWAARTELVLDDRSHRQVLRLVVAGPRNRRVVVA